MNDFRYKRSYKSLIDLIFRVGGIKMTRYICLGCEYENDDDIIEKICPYCGEHMIKNEIRYCSKCNQPLLPHEKDICDMCREITIASDSI